MPKSDNEHSVTVSVPRTNVLTVEALAGMMARINESAGCGLRHKNPYTSGR
jgi:hypothetical protein